MPLVYAALVPHSPLLIPTIGKENRSLIEATVSSLETIKRALGVVHPDVIAVISPHGTIRSHIQGFVSERYKTDFRRFGDLTYSEEFPSSYLFLVQLKKRARKFHFSLVTESMLDYGAGVPLTLIQNPLEERFAVSSIRTSSANKVVHFQFGCLLSEEIASTGKRVALLASGECSHCHMSPELGEESKAYDHSLIHSIKNRDIESFIHPLDPDRSLRLRSCVGKPLAVLLGALGEASYTPNILSYEQTLGVGMLTVEFTLS